MPNEVQKPGSARSITREAEKLARAIVTSNGDHRVQVTSLSDSVRRGARELNQAVLSSVSSKGMR